MLDHHSFIFVYNVENMIAIFYEMTQDVAIWCMLSKIQMSYQHAGASAPSCVIYTLKQIRPILNIWTLHHVVILLNAYNPKSQSNRNYIINTMSHNTTKKLLCELLLCASKYTQSNNSKWFKSKSIDPT